MPPLFFSLCACGHRGFVLHSVTRFPWPRFIHYYGFICHLTSLQASLKFPFENPLPHRGMMSGFPSYFADSLLMIPSSNTSCLYSRIGYRDTLHTHPGSLPNLVRFRYGPSTSYHFLQTPPLASDALMNRILFPVNRARPLSCNGWVCQLRWANNERIGTIRSTLLRLAFFRSLLR